MNIRRAQSIGILFLVIQFTILVGIILATYIRQHQTPRISYAEYRKTQEQLKQFRRIYGLKE